jgi:hypothetical protein
LATVEGDLKATADDAGRQFIIQLNVPGHDELFGQVNQRAVDFARQRAAELVTGVDDATRDEIAGIITAGLEENIGLDGITERLQDAYAFSQDRADLIARTEVGNANQNGVLEGMRIARDAGVKLKKVWLPDAGACDVCLENGDAGPIDIEDEFPSGDDAPLAHPNCECDMASDIEEDADDEDTGDEE